jgi:hypothetical protein
MMTEGESTLDVFLCAAESVFRHAFFDPYSMASMIGPVSTMLSSQSHPVKESIFSSS